MAETSIVTVEDVARLMQECSNWGRWGPEDQRGALNYLTPERVQAAAALVQDGVAVSCALPIGGPPDPEDAYPPVHLMLRAGDMANDLLGIPSDYVALMYHGYTITHLDALCHHIYQRQLYNGFPAEAVTSRGAQAGSIRAAATGVTGRGVLLDVPRALGRDWLDPGYAIGVDELEAAEAAQGVTVGEGDLLLVRTGRHARRRAGNPPIERIGGGLRNYPGLHWSCIPWLHERRIALLGCDTFSDAIPANVCDAGTAIHTVGLVGMGLHLLDNSDLEDLAFACAARNRWAFCLTIAPLRIDAGTGSPVNPIALF